MGGEDVRGNSPLSALADRVRSAHGGVEAATKKTLECAMEAGAALNEAKRAPPSAVVLSRLSRLSGASA